MGSRDFLLSKGRHERSWEPTKHHEGIKNLDPFVDGLEGSIADISRKRDLRLETSEVEFSSTMPGDLWQYRLNYTTSMRSFNSVKGAMDNRQPGMLA